MNHPILKNLGITAGKNIYQNLSYEELFQHETSASLSKEEKGIVSQLGAVAIDTGVFTGRSPKDKYIVKEPSSEQHVWWAMPGRLGSDNKPMTEATWDHLKTITLQQLNGKDLYVMDGFCGANPATRLAVRLVTEVAWQAHFFKNMFIRPTEEELKIFTPDWTILNACKTSCRDFAKYQLNSEVFVAFHLKERMTVIGGTWYGGEIKKGIFSIMNYFLPLKGIGSFHCSANRGAKGDMALFFGLSGTGKTSLSSDSKRSLIGDDEHGWNDEGVFNLEGGCYAKCINLTQEREPEIYDAIRRDALLENVEVDSSGKIDFASSRKTENSRVSYPMYHIHNIVKPISKGTHPKNIIFLTCDAFGVLPPVAKLNKEQAMYHYLSGYTAKVAGTELGVKEPKATFSACFSQPFLLLNPTRYAEILGRKMDEHTAQVYLINTGWIGGSLGVGKRIPLADNRATVDAILDGSMEQSPWETFPIFNFIIPKFVRGLDPKILNPRQFWQDKNAYDQTLKKVAGMFIENFKNFNDIPDAQKLIQAGPKL